MLVVVLVVVLCLVLSTHDFLNADVVWRCLVLCLCFSTIDLFYVDVVAFYFVFVFVNK